MFVIPTKLRMTKEFQAGISHVDMSGTSLLADKEALTLNN
jgi:hypothetical protein